MYKRILKPLFFLLSPETVHHFVFSFIKIAFAIPGVKSMVRSNYCINNEKLKVKVMGLTFPNAVGNIADYLESLAAMLPEK